MSWQEQGSSSGTSSRLITLLEEEKVSTLSCTAAGACTVMQGYCLQVTLSPLFMDLSHLEGRAPACPCMNNTAHGYRWLKILET